MKKELKPEDVVAVIDTREQKPLDLAPMRTKVATLDTADYSVAGLEHVVRIERKGMHDLLGCITTHRKRFEAEMQRMLAYPVRALVIEGSWTELEFGSPTWRSRVHPNSVYGSLIGWMAMGIQVYAANDHAGAAILVRRLLLSVARKRYRELLAFVENGVVVKE